MVPCISRLLPDIALADFITDPDISPVAFTFVTNTLLPVMFCPKMLPAIDIAPEPETNLLLRSKLPPNWGVVSAATLLIPEVDPVSIVTVNADPPPLVNVIILSAADAVITVVSSVVAIEDDMFVILAVSAVREPEMLPW